MASYMALTQGWVDAQGKVEPIQFEGELPAVELEFARRVRIADFPFASVLDTFKVGSIRAAEKRFEHDG